MARRRARSENSELFPGFTDVAEIGIGSLAVVYRAREIDTNRLVALKLLNVRDASPRALESFQRESVALGALSAHPHIVTLYRSFLAQDRRPVLVLELCSGSIADYMVGGQGLPPQQAVATAIKIAAALETAHRAGILHRDVKPQNILITEFGEPALADFGVAMLQSSTQTTAGLFDFTTLHAAPELLEGTATSAATDVYELASTLYQLLAGRSAFRAYDGESPASVILRILRDPVRPVVSAGVPVQLSDLVVQAMSKDKDERPPTAADFAGQLGRIEQAQGWPRTPFLVRALAGADGRRGFLAPRAFPVAPVPPAPAYPIPPTRPVAPAPTPPAPPAAAAPAAPAPPQPPVAPPAWIPAPMSGAFEPTISHASRASTEPTLSYARPAGPPAPGPVVDPEPAAPPAGDARRPYGVVGPAGPGPARLLVKGPGLPRRNLWALAAGWLVLVAFGVAGIASARGGLGVLVAVVLALIVCTAAAVAVATATFWVDDQQLFSRTGLRVSRVPWPAVGAIEPRLEGGGDHAAGPGCLVAWTQAGVLVLTATRRPVPELQHLHRQIESYRHRAQLAGGPPPGPYPAR